MQKENTPLPAAWVTKLYDAGGKYSPRSAILYCILSISSWGCSMRKPKANGLASICTFLRLNNSKISRAECPVANITASTVTSSFPFTCMLSILPSLMEKSVSLALNLMSPPALIMASRMFSIMPGNLLVPICGWALIKISGLAPWSTKVCKTFKTLPRFLLRV